MKRTEVAALRTKSIADLAAEQVKLQSTLVKGDDAHASRKLRRDRARVLTVLREKQIVALTKNNE